MSMGASSETTQETLVQNYTPQTASIAAQYQSQAAAAAAQASKQQTQMAIDSLRQSYASSIQALKPYTKSGIQALNELNSYLGLGGYDPGTAPKTPEKPTLEKTAQSLTKRDLLNYVYENSYMGEDGRMIYYGAGMDELGNHSPVDRVGGGGVK